MQDMTSDICSSVINTGESTSAQLVDIRDNNIYWATKEKDGHEGLDFNKEIDKMAKSNRLYSVVKAFSELNLDPETVDNMKMGYMFEDIIRRYSTNAEAGDHYTPREVIKLLVNILL